MKLGWNGLRCSNKSLQNNPMTRVIQIKIGSVRRVGLVDEPHVRLLDGCSSIYQRAQIAIDVPKKLSEVAHQRRQSDKLDCRLIYTGRSEWQMLRAMDLPQVSACGLISDTGLTHIGSARGRQSMHATATEDLTDSMKMFRWGVEGGRPLMNPVRVKKSKLGIVKVVPLG
jgi:hypothetical protein